MKGIVAVGNRLCSQDGVEALAIFTSTRAALRALIRLGGGDPGPGGDSRKNLQTEKSLRELLTYRENISRHENRC